MEPEKVAEIRRVAESGAQGLARLDAIRQGTRYWTQVLMTAVALARSQGATWREIGDALGISSQAAHERFTKGKLKVEVTVTGSRDVPGDP